MNELERHSPIAKEAMDERHYFISLLQNALSCGLVSPERLERIQAETAELLISRITRYTNGSSSSVRAETAQELSDSILYTIGVALKSMSLADAADSLSSVSLSHLFVTGQRIITKKVSVCRLLHAGLVRRLFPSENEFYASTVRDGIAGFFKLYRPEFFAHKTIITADYPTMQGEGNLCGIEFIERYLHNLYYENDLLRLFSPETAHAFLLRHNPGYEKAPSNLCEPILCAALLCVLCDVDPQSLVLRQEDFDTLYALLDGKDRDGLHFYFMHAASRLAERLDLDETAARYMTETVGKLLAGFENAVRFHTLEKFGYTA